MRHAVSAKNSLQNYNGFAPIQFVTGALPNLPSVLVNGLPALEEAEGDRTKTQLERMYSARRAFVKAESSEKIKRALRHLVRSCETNFVNGEKVYYKRAADNKWRGPAKVIGHLSTKVFVVHGSRVLRCSSSRVIPVNSTHTKGITKDDISLEEDQTNSSDDELSIVALTPLAENGDNSDDETQVENNSTQQNENEPEELRRSVRNRQAPARYIPEKGAWETETQEANIVFIPVSRHGEPEVIAAKEAELENWKATEAVDTVDDTGQKLISTRWVVTEKEIAPGQFKPKAKLVVRGFEETNEVQVDAPTASKAALRTH